MKGKGRRRETGGDKGQREEDRKRKSVWGGGGANGTAVSRHDLHLRLSPALGSQHR